MTYAELITEALRSVQENPSTPVFHTSATAGIAINEALTLFSFLTLCIESTAELTVASRWFSPAATQTTYLAPLSLHRNELRVSPIRLEDLQALSSTWRATSGAPARYMQAGWAKLGLWPSPDASYLLRLRYARSAATLVADSATPEIPAEHHRALLKFAVPAMKMLEAGNELVDVAPQLQEFFGYAREMAQYVQARARQLSYDTSPTEKWFGFAEAKAWSMLRTK